VIVRFTVAVCVTAPLVPVIVNVVLPAATPTVVTVSVELPVPVTDPALNVPFAPVGSPLTLRFTAPPNPFTAPTFTVYVALLPGLTVCVPGVAPTVKSGCPVTVIVTVAVCVTPPLAVPVIVSVELPAATPTVVTVSVELPVPVTDPGLNVPFAPAGSPLTLKFTAPLNPFNAPTFTVYVALPPALTVCVPGVAPIVKSGVACPKGTIWIPLIGARGSPSFEAPGVAVSVNDVALIVNTT
jgi:hypothetical protein